MNGSFVVNQLNLRFSSTFGRLSTLSSAILFISMSAIADDQSTSSATIPNTLAQNSTTTDSTTASTEVKTLSTLTFQAQTLPPKDPDISAVAKTIVTREEMEKYGDQSVSDTLRRAAGFQMPGGAGPRGAPGAMRFRGGGAPVFLINGEPVQGGPRGGGSVIDSITPDMIERIEITKQPSVAQASVASSAVINIILKVPLETSRIGGTARVGYGLAKSSSNEEERKNLSLQLDGRDNAWIYSLSMNQMWNDTTSVSQTLSPTGEEREQKRIFERNSFMFSPRLEYEIDDQQKVVGEVFYRKHQSNGQNQNQFQDDDNESIRFNTRYERKDQGNTDRVRLSIEKQDETESTKSALYNQYTKEQVNEYGLAYDGVRKLDQDKQIKFGADLRSNELESNVAQTLDEQRYALYTEGSWRYVPNQTVTLGVRQQWIERSGLVEYSDQFLSPVLAHRFDFTDQWSLQTNLSRSFKSPNSNSLMPTTTVSTDSDAGSLNNPDRGGNELLRPERITAIESTLGFNTAAGGVNITGFHREIKDYIERTISLEGNRYVQRPRNQDNATTYGLEVSGRYALQQTESGHSFMLNGQLSTVRATVEDTNNVERLVNDVAPYSASAGFSYNYQPWRLSTSVNVSYIPEFTRALSNQPYNRISNERFNIDFTATKRFQNGWATSLVARNILSTDYKERLINQADGSLYQARTNQSIPSFLINVEKKF